MTQTAPIPADTRRPPWRAVAAFASILLVLCPVIYRLHWRAPAVAAPDGVVTIRYMAWGNPEQLESERAIITRFNDKCAADGTNTRVELFMPPAGGYQQKLLMMLASGTAPDVVKVDNYYFPSLAAKGYFADLTDIAGRDPSFHAEDFHPVAMRENHYRGRLYGMNCLFGGLVCYYNKDLFRQAGLTDPYELWRQGKWTWAAFDDAAARLTQRDARGRTTSFGFVIYEVPTSPNAQCMALWLWREHADFLSADRARSALGSPHAARAIGELRDAVFVDHVCPSPSQVVSNICSFEAGNVAMSIENAGMAPRYRRIRNFEWDIAPTPSDPDNSFTQTKGNQLVMSAGCGHPREVWAWMRYYTSVETESLLCGDTFRRSVPTRLALLHDPQYLKANQPPFHIDVMVDLIDRGRPLPVDETWSAWTSTATRFMDRLYAQPDADVGETLSLAARAVDLDLDRERQRYQRYSQAGMAHAE